MFSHSCFYLLDWACYKLSPNKPCPWVQGLSFSPGWDERDCAFKRLHYHSGRPLALLVSQCWVKDPAPMPYMSLGLSQLSSMGRSTPYYSRFLIPSLYLPTPPPIHKCPTVRIIGICTQKLSQPHPQLLPKGRKCSHLPSGFSQPGALGHFPHHSYMGHSSCSTAAWAFVWWALDLDASRLNWEVDRRSCVWWEKPMHASGPTVYSTLSGAQ